MFLPEFDGASGSSPALYKLAHASPGRVPFTP